MCTPYAPAKKDKEKIRRDLIKDKLDEIRDLIADPEEFLSFGKLLNRAADFLNVHYTSRSSTASSTGLSSSSSSSTTASPAPGPIRGNRKEVHNLREQARRDLQSTGFEALKHFIKTNNLDGGRKKLERIHIVEIAVKQIQKIKASGATTPAPVVRAPSPAVVAPTAAAAPLPMPVAPLLAQPIFQDPNFMLNWAMISMNMQMMQNFGQFFPVIPYQVAPVAEDIDNNEEEEEIIEVVN